MSPNLPTMAMLWVWQKRLHYYSQMEKIKEKNKQTKEPPGSVQQECGKMKTWTWIFKNKTPRLLR